MSERVPPQNAEAEEHVLGAMMMAESAIDRVAEVLEPNGARKFYRESNGVVYAIALAMRQLGEPVDALTLAAELERRGMAAQTGGADRLRELRSITPTHSNAAHYAGLVLEAWKRRELIKLADAVSRPAWEGTGTADEALSAAEAAMLDLRASIERGRKTVVPLRDSVWRWAQKTESPPEEEPGVPAPLGLPRFRPGRLYVLGGYASDGKSVLAAQCARTVAESGRRVGIVTLEMSEEDLTERMITSFGVPYRQVQTGRVEAEYRSAAVAAISGLTALDIHLIDDESADATDIWRYQMLGRYDFLVIDHLHQIDWDERRVLERQVRTIWQVARRSHIPILLLSQLSRQRDFSRPTLSSFRESGVIEQLAAVAMAIWLERDEKGNVLNDAELILLKNRYGRRLTHHLRLVPAEVRFEARQHA